MKKILVILISFFSFAAVFADEKTDSTDDIQFNYEIRKSAIKDYRQMVSDVSRDTTFAQYLVEFATLCGNIGDYEEAIQAMTEASNICEEVYGHENYKYTTLLSYLADCYFSLKNYDEAIRLGTEALEIKRKLLGTDHPEYAALLVGLAKCYYALGNFNEAIRLVTEALEIKREMLGMDHPECATLLVNLADCYFALKNYDEAIHSGTEALEIKRKTLGTDNLEYAALLCSLAGCYFALNNHDETIRLGTKALEIKRKLLGTDNLEYAFLLCSLANSYYALSKYNKAIGLVNESLDIIKRTNGIECLEYATTLGKLSGCYYALSNYDEAIKIGTEALKIMDRTSGKENLAYAVSIADLSSCYYAISDFDMSISLINESLGIIKRIYGIDCSEYATSLGKLADNYYALGKYNDAIRYGLESLEIMNRICGKDNQNYAIQLGHIAGYYYSLGNYNEAVYLNAKALEIYKKTLGTDNHDYANLLGNLAIMYFNSGNYHEAIRLVTEALEILKKACNTDHPDYARQLGNLADYYSAICKYDAAIRYGTKSLEIYKKVFGTNHIEYARVLGDLAVNYFALRNFKEAIRLASESLEIKRRTLGKDHLDCAKSLFNVAFYYHYLGNNNDASRLMCDYVQVVRKNVLGVFSGLTANERRMYWNKYRYFFNERTPQIFVQSETPNISSFLYDNIALFSKGLLLSTELEMAKLIQDRGDEEAVQMYSELRQNRQILNFQYSKPIAERKINCDSLERVSTELERKLGSLVQEFGDFTQNLRITWKAVQDKLDDSDIAIEYLSYPENDSTTGYVALTLCKNDTVPLLTQLFTESQLKDVAGDDDTYQNAAADSLIWGPLASRLEGKSRIYFSAAGMLHSIGIEYLPSMEGKDCYRLSSTRELVTHKSGEGIKSATLFGDIDYDATYASIKSSAPTIPSVPVVPSTPSTILYAENKEYGPIISKSGRGGFDEYGSMRTMRYSVDSLPGSRKEIQDISALLKKSGFKVQDCDTITRNQASEESFKALSGQRRSLIHISTHGFYYDTIKAQNMSEHLRLMLMGDDRPSRSEDRSLLRCGLCFAGANQFLREMKNPADGQDEGILNALEIAQTDLRGLDLVVLSACQTALGDVVNGEGVFGLQRGFKKAGAQSILMSLWIVDDDITALLMTEFYRAWTSSPDMTKAGALKAAQDAVKKEYPNPHDWAGFILIDALD